jgi:hypothetical protein
MLFKTGKTGVKSLVNLLNSAVKGVTSQNLINKVIGKNANKLLKKLGKFVARIPLAGGLFAYVFVQVDSSGKVVISALGGAKNLSVWTLDTIKGVATKFTKGLTRRRRKKRKSSKSTTRRKRRKRRKKRKK